MLASAVFAQQASERPGVGISELYLAKDNGLGAAGVAAAEFLPTDIPIYCIVQLNSAVPTTVKMNLIAVSVHGVKSETHVVSTTYTTKDGQDRVNFTGRPDGRWVVGKYRVDVYIDGRPIASREFTVSKAPQKTRPLTDAISTPKPVRPAKPTIHPARVDSISASLKSTN